MKSSHKEGWEDLPHSYTEEMAGTRAPIPLIGKAGGGSGWEAIMKAPLLSSLHLAVAQSQAVGCDGMLIPGTFQVQHWNLLIIEYNMKEQHEREFKPEQTEGWSCCLTPFFFDFQTGPHVFQVGLELTM